MKTAWMGDPDEFPWVGVENQPGVYSRFLGEDLERGPWVVQVKLDPNVQGSAHWHEVDTVYVVTQGSLSFGFGDRVCHAGELRWCRAGYFYGPETAGPEGCEFYLVGSGPQLQPNRDRATAKGLAVA